MEKTLVDLARMVVELASKKKKKMAFAESCTGGLVSSLITDISGSSDVFEGSFVSYSNDFKISLLEVDRNIIDGHGAVSEQTAIAMAMQVKKITDVNIALSLTGIAGPSGGTIDKPVGTLYLCSVSDTGKEVRAFRFSGERKELKESFARVALLFLLEILEVN